MIINYDPNAFNPTFLSDGIENSGHILADMLDNVAQRFHEYDLPDDCIDNAIHRACEFLGMPDIPWKFDHEVGIYTNNPTTFSDDIIGVDKEQLFKLDIHNSDNLSLIMTHEIIHGLLQYLSAEGHFSPWQEELICDTFMGVRAEVEGLSTIRIEEGLQNSEASDTHPYGELRIKYIEIGKEIAEELQERDLPITPDNILSRLDDYLAADAEHIHEQEEIEYQKHHSSHKGYKPDYTEAEIANLKEKLESTKYRRSCVQSELNHWESNKSVLRDNKDRISDYNHAVSKVNELRSKLSNANAEVRDAEIKLNNAL